MRAAAKFESFDEIKKLLHRFDLNSFHDEAMLAEYSEIFGIGLLCRQLEEDRITAGKSELLRSVSAFEEKPLEPQMEDLCRLHWLALSRKAVSVLEFGSGFSTVVLAHAMNLLSGFFEDWAKSNLRCQKPFHVHSIEEEQRFLEISQKRLSKVLKSFATLYRSSVDMVCVENRIATLYSKLPNVSPDLIYLDGPSQFATTQEIRGFSFASPERMPMSADVLTFEFFLQPGTLVLVDGRTANARFLKAMLKRNWSYLHDVAGDTHLFELQEEPLGPINRRQIEFCLPDGWLLPTAASQRGS
jgi:hypothetical protein